jgi:hypothetical protein
MLYCSQALCLGTLIYNFWILDSDWIYLQYGSCFAELDVLSLEMEVSPELESSTVYGGLRKYRFIPVSFFEEHFLFNFDNKTKAWIWFCGEFGFHTL